MTTSSSAAGGRAAPIGGHALIGDGRASALVDTAGTIDWFSLPEDVHLGIFDALLDAGSGGRFDLAPAEPAVTSRRYLERSMVLETTFRTTRGVLVVTDCLTWHNGARLPWIELARRIRCTAGRVDLVWMVEPTLTLAHPRQPLREHHGLFQAAHDGARTGLLSWDAGTPRTTDHGAQGQTALVAGDDALLAVVVVVGEPLVRPDRDEVEGRIDSTVHAWGTWSEGVHYEGRWREQVHQSARVLKLLVHGPDGAVMAAPTTSLPEQVGGTRNYDYRYCWIRDSSFTIDAFLRIGLVEEAHRALTALVRMAHRTAPHLAPFYAVDGSVPGGDEELDLPGYRGSTPVVRGNAASGQLQIGSWGDLFEAVWIYVRQGNDLDPATGQLMASLADRVCEVWREEDAGIWELPEARHYTVSKLRAWLALDRALRLAGADQLGGDTERWRSEREEIRTFIDGRCWSADRSAYAFCADSDELDASCLLAARIGFVAGTSEQMRGTIAAVRDELCEGPFVWRYSGQRTQEGAFLACSFWMVDALVRAGCLEEAATQMDGTLAAMNPLGLLSEQYDPDADELLGNFPQGLSHLALVNAASSYTEAREQRRKASADAER